MSYALSAIRWSPAKKLDLPPVSGFIVAKYLRSDTYVAPRHAVSPQPSPPAPHLRPDAVAVAVRGAGNGNNRIELDNVPVYGSTHLFGIFSVFHPSIVKDAQFQLGGINAGSGNLLSSLLQVNTVVPEIKPIFL